MTKEQHIKAIAYRLADDIETKAQRYIALGMDRDRAVMLTIAEMSGHLQIVKG